MRGLVICVIVALVAYVAAQTATPLVFERDQEIWTAYLGDPAGVFAGGIANDSSAVTYQNGAGAMVCAHAVGNESSNSTTYSLKCFVHAVLVQATSVGITIEGGNSTGSNSTDTVFTFPSGAQLPASATFPLTPDQLVALRAGRMRASVFGSGSGSNGSANILLAGNLKSNANFVATGVSDASPAAGAILVATISKEARTLWYFVIQNVLGASSTANQNAGAITIWADTSDLSGIIGDENQQGQDRHIWAETMQFNVASQVITGVLPLPSVLGQFVTGFTAGNPTNVHLLLKKLLPAGSTSSAGDSLGMPIWTARTF